MAGQRETDDTRRADASAVPIPEPLRRLSDTIREQHRRLLDQIGEQVERCQEWAEIRRSTLPHETAASLIQQLSQLLASAPATQSPQDSVLAPIERELRSACVTRVHPLRVAYLGPEYSYSHLAAIERFGQSATLLPMATIASVFEEVAREQAEFGLVPLENSTDGRISDTLDVLARAPARICGEVQLRIHHCLWGTGTLGDVRQVHSKPQALSQCRHWLAQNLRDAEFVPTASTTTAARLAQQRPDVAAVASRPAGLALGLNLLAENIEDRPDNITRFAVIGNLGNERTGNDKTSVMFELPHRPGALADAMVVFKRNRLNLTWIESFPKPGSPQEYVFFVEFLGHAEDPRARRALRDLVPKTVRTTILGSYPAASPV